MIYEFMEIIFFFILVLKCREFLKIWTSFSSLVSKASQKNFGEVRNRKNLRALNRYLIPFFDPPLNACKCVYNRYPLRGRRFTGLLLSDRTLIRAAVNSVSCLTVIL